MTIEIRLRDAETAECAGRVVRDHTPVFFAMCRKLLAAGTDPKELVQVIAPTGTPSFTGS